MKSSVECTDTYALVKLEGSMSNEYLDEIEQVFNDVITRKLHVLLDMSEVSFICSSVLSLLFSNNAQTSAYGKKFCLFGLQSDIRKIFTITGIENHLSLYNTLEESISALPNKKN